MRRNLARSEFAFSLLTALGALSACNTMAGALQNSADQNK